MNMFRMDHMLKDGWSGFYSQGYMYFDNCSSLFLPKVCQRDKRVCLVTHESNQTKQHITDWSLWSVLSPRRIIPTSTLTNPSPAQRYISDRSIGLSDSNTLFTSSLSSLFCLEWPIQSEHGLAWQAGKTCWFSSADELAEPNLLNVVLANGTAVVVYVFVWY